MWWRMFVAWCHSVMLGHMNRVDDDPVAPAPAPVVLPEPLNVGDPVVNLFCGTVIGVAVSTSGQVLYVVERNDQFQIFTREELEINKGGH